LKERYIVIEASNGEEAINLARTKKPDLILMDIMMPKTDGYIACSIIKGDQTTEKIPVIMLTAVDHELNVQFSKDMGASGYITKPFNIEDVLCQVKQAIGE
jgi:CheY-like chemotaxis protein